MFTYHGRQLDISEEMLSDYRYYVGTPLTERWADIYVFNRFVGDGENYVNRFTDLSNEDLTRIIESGMKSEINARK